MDQQTIDISATSQSMVQILISEDFTVLGKGLGKVQHETSNVLWPYRETRTSYGDNFNDINKSTYRNAHIKDDGSRIPKRVLNA